ncbi:MAG: hypothetical protein GXP31_04625 [Kiritimatiellaeota bacterium]|nr:hypothetical protein [Kiritimatiellota bacterium]
MKDPRSPSRDRFSNRSAACLSAGLGAMLWLVTPAAILLLGTSGCETTELTTLEAESGAYREAREFLHAGRTTQAEVRKKYGKPLEVLPVKGGGVLWRYRRSEAVVVNAFTDTPLGTDGAILAGQRGYQHTVIRNTQMDLLFDQQGVLKDYRLLRNAP